MTLESFGSIAPSAIQKKTRDLHGALHYGHRALVRERRRSVRVKASGARSDVRPRRLPRRLHDDAFPAVPERRLPRLRSGDVSASSDLVFDGRQLETHGESCPLSLTLSIPLSLSISNPATYCDVSCPPALTSS